MIALLIIVAVGMTVQHLLTIKRIQRIEDKMWKDNLTMLKGLNFIMDKSIAIESKLSEIEAKTPYKKRVRKVKVAGVEVPIEAQETKSANANGADVIIDNDKTDKEEL